MKDVSGGRKIFPKFSYVKNAPRDRWNNFALAHFFCAPSCPRARALLAARAPYWPRWGSTSHDMKIFEKNFNHPKRCSSTQYTTLLSRTFFARPVGRAHALLAAKVEKKFLAQKI